MRRYIHHKYHWVRTHPNHWLRKSIAVGLIIGGLLGFLPVLGFWMLPLGLILLATDLPSVRRFNRRVYVWWGRRVRNWNGKPRGNGR